MMRSVSIRARTAMLIGLGTLIVPTGCEEKDRGPKRADHEAAHSARYHPEVHRPSPDARSDDQPPASMPSSLPADWTGPRGPAGSPVLFVNGEAISVPEVLEPIVDDLATQSRSLRYRDYYQYVFREAGEQIRELINLTLVYQKAKIAYEDENARKLVDRRADDMIRDVINLRYDGVHARYEQHLKSLDLTLDDIKERARRQILVTQFLRERFLPQVEEPRRRELLHYYRTHENDFTTPATAELFLIEVPLTAELGKPLDDATVAELAVAKTNARRVLAKARQELDSGVEFEAVAKRYSKGVRAAGGGAWGAISPGSLTGRWARAVEVLFTLKAGEISEIVEGPESFFIVRCGSSKPAEHVPFEEAQKEIVARLKEADYNRLTSDYILELRRQSTIDQRQQEEFFYAVVSAAPRPEQQELAREDPKEP